jgi:hypothetical protein
MEIYNGTYCVYIHTNKINGKMYVGRTINGDNPNKRWSNGYGYATQKYFYRAIKKYGWNGFLHEIVASNLTEQEANNFERLLIEKLKTYDKDFGYNLTLGGQGTTGYHMSEESKRKRNVTMQKYFSDPKYIQLMRDVAPKRAIMRFTLDGVFIDKYDSAMEAERQIGVLNSTISQCAFGKLPSAGGYIFLFEEDVNNIKQRVERYLHAKKPRNEPIVQLSLDGEFISEWDGSADAGKALNMNYKNINAVCRGKRNKAGGYRWMYLSDYQKMCKTQNDEI